MFTQIWAGADGHHNETSLSLAAKVADLYECWQLRDGVMQHNLDYPELEHRRFLVPAEVHRPFAGSDLFGRIGGQATVETLIDGLYDRIERDALLYPLFGRDLTAERKGQKCFFSEWLGGEREYSNIAHLPLKHRHDLLPITRALADKWLEHFRASLKIAVPDAEARCLIYEKVSLLAVALVNEGEPRSALRARQHGACLRYQPAVKSLDLARRGDAAALRELLSYAPDILESMPHSAKLMHLAVLAGRRHVVDLLLDNGVDVNKPSPIKTLIFVTPLCTARLKRRREIAAVLLRHGAIEDIFTHAFLGDLEALREDLARAPYSAQASDPAVDALDITPVHHAVAGDRAEALFQLLSRIAQANEPVRGAKRSLALAVERENVAVVAKLLELGADATTIGAGRWVLHPELSPLLSHAGAHIDRSGGWIQASCTGNQGRKDDPEYVAAFLHHGARVDDKRTTLQNSDGGRATALHYAAKAGFVKTIEVLLDHGADPTARDDNGFTPRDWLDRASKSVDRDAVRRLLNRGRVR
jgi:truncated hemoglobin YjbI/ankyrin repeat protein